MAVKTERDRERMNARSGRGTVPETHLKIFKLFNNYVNNCKLLQPQQEQDYKVEHISAVRHLGHEAAEERKAFPRCVARNRTPVST